MKLIANTFSISPSRFLAGTCGSFGSAQMEIEFSPEWDGLGKKIVFSPPSGAPVSVVLDGNTVTVPYEVMACRGVSRFAIFGSNGDRTLITVTGEIDVLSTLSPDAENSGEPTADEMSQVLGYMEQTLQTAESLQMAAECGAFDGKPAGFGEISASVRTLLPGSIPTVTVTADGADTAKNIHFSFALPPAEETAGKRYSVRFFGASPDGVREDDAAGMVAQVAVGDGAVRNDFDALPFFNRPICCCRWSESERRWQVVAYRGEPGFSFDGSCGDVMYECTPFFYRVEMSGDGSPTYVSVTGSRMTGYELAPMFRNDTDKVYCPCFPTATVNGTWTSRAGVMPDNNSLDGFMNGAKQWHTGACIEPIEAYFSDCLLLWVEFATKNWKSVMSGAASLSYNQSTARITSVISEKEFEVSATTASSFAVGQTVAIGSTANGNQRTDAAFIASISGTRITLEQAVSGLRVGDYLSSRMYRNGCAALAVINASSGSPVSNTDRLHPCIWRGKENPWGNSLDTIGNLLTARHGSGTASDPYRYRLQYLADPAAYANGSISDDYTEADFDMANEDGYAKTVMADSRLRFVMAPAACGASSSTYTGAYYHTPRHAVDSVHVGGGFLGGDGCGMYMDCSTAPSAYTVQHTARFHLK